VSNEQDVSVRSPLELLEARNAQLEATIARVREIVGDTYTDAAESFRNEGEYVYGFARGEASALSEVRDALERGTGEAVK
jgi:hypothetical protein